MLEPGDVSWLSFVLFNFHYSLEWRVSMNQFSVLPLCSMLLDKKFKSELVRFGAEAAAKLGTRSNRYETLLKQRHVQVSESRLFRGQFFCCFFYGSKYNRRPSIRKWKTFITQCNAKQSNGAQGNATQRNATLEVDHNFPTDFIAVLVDFQLKFFNVLVQ